MLHFTYLKTGNKRTYYLCNGSPLHSGPLKQIKATNIGGFLPSTIKKSLRSKTMDNNYVRKILQQMKTTILNHPNTLQSTKVDSQSIHCIQFIIPEMTIKLGIL